uniref:Uncharacterized protein n=1 Tax=Lepeophtheirus salmonis TaxID=72036 RepID=A0A0K2TGP9_LEPSM
MAQSLDIIFFYL